jgi:hypothetical protein
MSEMGVPEVKQIPPIQPQPVTAADRKAEEELSKDENVERLLRKQLHTLRRRVAIWALTLSVVFIVLSLMLLAGQAAIKHSSLDWIPFRSSPEKVIFLIGGLFIAPTFILISVLKAVFVGKDDEKKTDDKTSSMPATDAVKTVVKTLS